LDCLSTSDCLAVGGSYDLPNGVVVLRWNGTAWVRQRQTFSLSASAYLGALSCSSRRFCTATGDYNPSSSGDSGSTRTFAVSWNGRTWSKQKTWNSRKGDTLNGISCTARNACTAVGFIGNGVRPLIEQSGARGAAAFTG
jgi:hypothetical protein